MKFLTDRKEIALKINVERIPVISMNIKESMAGYPHCYEGGKIEIKYPTIGYANRADDLYIQCTLKMFEDGNSIAHEFPWLYKKIGLYPEPVFLQNSFSTKDVLEMAEWNNVRRAQEGDQVVVMFNDGYNVYLRLMRIGKVKANVFPTAILEDIE